MPRGLYDMTEEELAAHNAVRQARLAAKMAANVKRYYARQHETNLRGYRARTLHNKLAWQRVNPERVAEISLGVRRRAIASGKHVCHDCGFGLASAHALEKHKGSNIHA
jgi:hypothetical protein